MDIGVGAFENTIVGTNDGLEGMCWGSHKKKQHCDDGSVEQHDHRHRRRVVVRLLSLCVCCCRRHRFCHFFFSQKCESFCSVLTRSEGVVEKC